MDNGVHGIVRLGHLEEIFSRVGKPYPECTSWNRTKIFHEGEWRELDDLVPRPELRKIISEGILSLSYEEIEKYDDASLQEWVSKRTDNKGIHLSFWYLGWLACMGGNSYESISAGELLFYIKECLTKLGGLANMGACFRGGPSFLTESLAEVIKEKGGEIRFNSEVSSIVIKDREVHGVKVEIEERIIPIQVLNTEFIEAPIVVNTLPVWDIFTVVSPDEFPTWYVDWIREIEHKVTFCWGIRYSLSRPIMDESTMGWWLKSPRNGEMSPGSIMPMPSYGEAANEYVADFWQQGSWLGGPSPVQRGTAMVKREALKMLDFFEEDIKALFPDIEAHCCWKIYYFHTYGIAGSPRLVGKYRPSIQPPGIKNLYLVSDTLRDTRAAGMASAARCALLCADRILGKK